jgi:hypothetical protein
MKQRSGKPTQLDARSGFRRADQVSHVETIRAFKALRVRASGRAAFFLRSHDDHNKTTS